jgi:hypothetical protein
MTDATAKRRQRRGDGTVYQTGDGRFRGAVTVPHALTGEPVRRYLSGRTATEVRSKMAAARAERQTVGRTPTVAVWGERWLALVRHRVRPATVGVRPTVCRSARAAATLERTSVAVRPER